MSNYKFVCLNKTSNAPRFSMIEYIKAIEENTVLWNRDNIYFHRREMREQAWLVVARRIFPNYEQLSEVEKEKLSPQSLQKRWKNVRDNFFRMLRLKQTEDVQTRYVYEKELSFLLKTTNRFIYNKANEYDETESETQTRANEQQTHATTTTNKQQKQIKKNLVYPDYPSGVGYKKQKVKAQTKKIAVKRVSALKSAINKRKNAAKNVKPSTMRKRTRLSCKQDQQEYVSIEEEEAPVAASVVEEATKTAAEANLPSIIFDKDALPAASSSDSLQSLTLPAAKMEIAPTSTLNPATDTLDTLTKTSPPDTLTVNCNSSEIVDADQAFFDTIKPLMRTMTIDEKLDFQIEILRLLKNYRTKHKF